MSDEKMGNTCSSVGTHTFERELFFTTAISLSHVNLVWWMCIAYDRMPQWGKTKRVHKNVPMKENGDKEKKSSYDVFTHCLKIYYDAPPAHSSPLSLHDYAYITSPNIYAYAVDKKLATKTYIRWSLGNWKECTDIDQYLLILILKWSW